jgi:hypothetical protein
MFMFGMIQDGPRGIQQFIAPEEEEQEFVDFASYGVDWDVNDDPVLMRHLLQHNPQDFPTDDPFGPLTTPHRLSDVPCEAPDRPLTITQVLTLNTLLAQRIDIHSRNMQTRRLMWQHALAICSTFI